MTSKLSKETLLSRQIPMVVCGHTEPDKLLRLGFYKITTEAVINNSHDDCHNTIIPTKHVVEVFILNTLGTGPCIHTFLKNNYVYLALGANPMNQF